jgi:hypothetical protein
MSSKKLTAEMEKLQHESFNYFVHETNPANGLMIDKTKVDWPASIATTGLALALRGGRRARIYVAPRGGRTSADDAALFLNSPQGPESDTAGYQGFYYHFLDIRPGDALGNASSQQ